jgi:chemotaxis protein histidine kinase CheA
MRGATECAKRLKLLISSLRSQLGKVNPPTPGDPITQMLMGILSRDVPTTKAAEGVDRLRGMVVDYNELRVIPPIELFEVLGDMPEARTKAEDISRSLNSIFAMEHDVSFERAAQMNKRDLNEYLLKIDGLEAYTRARVRLLGLQKHAIPLDGAMWAYARQQEIVNPKSDLEESQQFLERQIKDSDALEVVALLYAQAWSECGNAVKKGQVEAIRSTPPDRTARNMLQMIAGNVPAEPDEVPSAAAPAAAEKGKERAATKTAAKAKNTKKKPAAKKASKPAAKKSTATQKKAPAKKAAKRKSAGKKKRSTTSRAKASKVAKTSSRKTSRRKAKTA